MTAALKKVFLFGGTCALLCGKQSVILFCSCGFVQESALEVFVEWQQFGSRFWQSTQGETPDSTIMAFNGLN